MAMADIENKSPCDADAQLEREIREGRKFTLEEAIGRLAGPGALKGESPISRLQQAQTEIGSWLSAHLVDGGGVLGAVLFRCVKDNELLLNNPDRPLVVLAGCLQHIFASEYLLEELVRRADVEWGREMDERPFFEIPGQPNNPDDPYTCDSMRKVLQGLLKQLEVDATTA
jgi:hypothetical protein